MTGNSNQVTIILAAIFVLCTGTKNYSLSVDHSDSVRPCHGVSLGKNKNRIGTYADLWGSEVFIVSRENGLKLSLSYIILDQDLELEGFFPLKVVSKPSCMYVSRCTLFLSQELAIGQGPCVEIDVCPFLERGVCSSYWEGGDSLERQESMLERLPTGGKTAEQVFRKESRGN